ncbi:hypothetical protein TNCT_428451 [Trichonephila clavata]|uniref:Uncharacterized protein n=1 Tax=Trichonephila clavata TaxID=2740835 RepID=A0A8X6I3B4_TRICU|nr:hypothetical protein TNCT_428451 [Trichonephila clavata]
MDEGNEPRGIEINGLEVYETFAWLVRLMDVLSSFHYKIPLYFSMPYLAIQISIAYLIPENRRRFIASTAASSFFCYFCAEGASIFQIDADPDRVSRFTAQGSLYIFFLFVIEMIRIYRHHNR